MGDQLQDLKQPRLARTLLGARNREVRRGLGRLDRVRVRRPHREGVRLHLCEYDEATDEASDIIEKDGAEGWEFRRHGGLLSIGDSFRGEPAELP